MIKEGAKFWRLTVLEFLGRDHKSNGIYYCQCDCGNFIELKEYSLKRSITKSCGCYRKEKMTTHGLITSPLYNDW